MSASTAHERAEAAVEAASDTIRARKLAYKKEIAQSLGRGPVGDEAILRVIVGGDFNSQLPGEVPERTGARVLPDP